jgi:hypothetical protein
MTDILIEEGGDVLLRGGDFASGTSDEQQVQLILASSQGEWKQYPELGVALYRAKNGRIDSFMERDIRVQLQADGFVLERLSTNEDGMSIDGSY